MTFTPGPWWKSYDLGTYEIRANGGVVVAKECTLENATAIESVPDMLTALKLIVQLKHDELNKWLLSVNAKYPTLLGYAEAAIAKAEGR